MMEVSQKRKLLGAIDILVRRPAAANEKTVGEAMAYFKMLLEESLHGQIEVVYVVKEQVK